MRDQSHRTHPDVQEDKNGTADTRQGAQMFCLLNNDANTGTVITVSPDLIPAMVAIRQPTAQQPLLQSDPDKLH